jgi:hypothetical protein
MKKFLCTKHIYIIKIIKPCNNKNSPVFAEEKTIVKFTKVTSPVVTVKKGKTAVEFPTYVRLAFSPSYVVNTNALPAGISTFPGFEVFPLANDAPIMAIVPKFTADAIAALIVLQAAPGSLQLFSKIVTELLT